MTQGKPPDLRPGDFVTGRTFIDLAASIPPLVEGSDSIKVTTVGPVATLEVIPPAQLPGQPRLFAINRIFGDYMLCDWVLGGKSVYVAKPPTLQQSASDGLTIANHEGIDYDFVFDTGDPTGQRRLSTLSSDEDDTETQVVVPRYIEGQIFWAVYVGDAGVDPDDGSVVAWLDGNSDSRAWGKSNE